MISPNSPKSTSKFMRQGHTAGPYGNEPNIEPIGVAAKKPRELKA